MALIMFLVFIISCSICFAYNKMRNMQCIVMDVIYIIAAVFIVISAVALICIIGSEFRSFLTGN